MPALTTTVSKSYFPLGSSTFVSPMVIRILQVGGYFFVSLFLIKVNQYLFYHFDTNPAVILMPAGVDVAIVYLFGYRYLVAVFFAWLVGVLTSPAQIPLVVTGIVAGGYTLQAGVGAFVLTRLHFSGTMRRTRDALIVVAVSLVVPVVAPTVTTLFQMLIHTLGTSAWTTWSRAWAGGVLSMMVLMPLVTTWYERGIRSFNTHSWLERMSALLALIAVTYLTFWTTLPRLNVFIILYLLFAALFWISLRFEPRYTVLSMFLMAAVGMAGSIIAHPQSIPLNQQLLADELFVVLIAPLFFILSTVVEESRVSANEARIRAEELEAANKRLSLEDQAKNDFVATLAHELRNPLAPVVSSLELLKLELEKLNQSHLITLVEVADAHNGTLIHLLDDLLDVSRISRKKFKLNKTATSVARVVELARRTVETLYASKHHTLTIMLPQESASIEADPVRLEQILVNLLTNAAKYTKSGGRIELSLAFVHNDLHIRVKDNGIGIQSHMLQKIFEPFIQSSEHNTGLGIGLSLTKRLVELHGGTIAVSSAGLGKGSEFVIVLPDAKTIQPPLQTTEERGRRGFSLRMKTNGNTFRILVVDDNQAAAEGLATLLMHKGHKATTAYSGEQALMLTQEGEYDVILLDIGMPDMDGYAVTKALRENQGFPGSIVALTGYGQHEDKRKAEASGFDYHLTKPVSIKDVETVLARIESHLALV